MTSPGKLRIKHGLQVLIPAMKLTTERPFANPEAAARKLVELAANIEAVQDGRMAQVNSCAPV